MSDHPVEDRIDDLLRGLSGGPFGILDWIRNALHDVLHPMASVIDWAIRAASSLAQGAYNFAVGLYNDAVRYASTVYGWARDFATGLYNAATSLARTLVDSAVGYAQQLFNGAVGLARQLVDGAIGLAQRLYNDAVGLARTLVDRAIQLAAAALQAFARDVIAPIERNVGHLLDEVFGWAKPLLRLVEAGAHWIEWVTVKAVPEVLDAWRFMMTHDPTDLTYLASVAAGTFHDDARELAKHYVR